MQGLSGQDHSGEESGGGAGDAPMPRDSSYTLQRQRIQQESLLAESFK